MKRWHFDFSHPFQPKNYAFPKKKFGMQNRSFQPTWFEQFPWLHYNEQKDSVLCFICAKQNDKGNLRTETKKEYSFITEGFSNWKKALARFKEHESSDCHKTSFDYEVKFPKTCGDVFEMASEQNRKTMQGNRRCLIKIIENLQYFCRQGQAIQGDTDLESNFFQLVKLRSKDDSLLLDWIQKKNNKYLSHDIQNEIVGIMAHQVLRDIVKDVGFNFFSLIADEYTDISNQEQLTLCLRWVDDHLEAHEDFLGFYNIPNIQSNTIVSVIKDALVRLQLSLSYCRGQCYDGASNMLGNRSGVAKHIQECQPKAHPTHCHGHSLSLGVKDATKNCKILSDAMSNTNEVVKLVKFSPKRENLLGEVKSNLEEEDATAAGLTKFSATRWTVRATCFQRVLNNYNALLTLWNECLQSDPKPDPDVRGRIIGCQAQMKSFDFFFGLNLGQRIFSHTDNLSESLQKSSMSAASGQHNAKLTMNALKQIRSNDCFKAFNETVLLKKEPHPDISEPEIPRRRRAPARLEVGSGQHFFPDTSDDVYRRIYFEALDLIISAISERFNQPSFVAYKNLESLLINFLNGKDISSEMEFLRINYAEDIGHDYLLPQLEIFKLLMKAKKIDCFADILDAVKNFASNEKNMISEIIIICKLLHVNPAISATGERSFSMARRVKTWLRAKMSHQRFNHVAILNAHKARTDKVRLVDIANEFVSRNENRKRNFGTFTEADLFQTEKIQ